MITSGSERLQLAWRPFQFRLPRALVTAHGSLVERRGWLLRLSRADGAVGWGEAAPWPQPAAQGPASQGPLAVDPGPPALALLVATIQELGPSRTRLELEGALPALPASLAFALGLALAELDGLGASAAAVELAAFGPGERPPAQRRGEELASADPVAEVGQTGLGGPGGRDPRGRESAAGGRGEPGQRLPEFGAQEPGHGHHERGDHPGPCQGREPDRAVAVPGRQGGAGPWRAAPASAWLLPAGQAALAALEPLVSGPPAAGPLTVKWKVAAGADPEERAVLEQLLARLPVGSRLRLDANGGWDRPTAWAWAERLAAEPRLEWLEQPLAPADLEGLAALAAAVPVALDESLRLDPQLASRWPGWQVRRPSLEGDPRPLLQALLARTPRLMLSTAFETGIGRRYLAHLAALQQDGPTPTAPGLAPGWRPAGALFANDPAMVWAAAGR